MFQKFPWPSALGLLYPVLAMIHMATSTPASAIEIIGWGLAQLGYLCAAAGVLAGTFKVFGLNTRKSVFIFALAVFLGGTVLVNIPKG